MFKFLGTFDSSFFSLAIGKYKIVFAFVRVRIILYNVDEYNFFCAQQLCGQETFPLYISKSNISK